ncbi:MAG: phenylalanine--tRNA ligase subunit beta [Candidatus Ratteibacteria bacterium]|jgi:phenylalanyl-tRNA synthetase beta chain
MRYSFKWLQELIPLDGISFSDLLGGLTGIGLHSETVVTEGEDHVFELEIPANRGDLLSIWGLSREISALFRLPGPAFPFHPTREVTSEENRLKVTVDALDACPFYSGCLISGVNLRESPKGVAGKIETLGFRSLNNVVDVTNYTLLELGQPLHAFDADRICGGIQVRFARSGEVLITIDGTERKLNENILVIADSAKVLALAGIMGGKESEVTGKTKNIFLESAFFHSGKIRSGCKNLSLETEASLRFERGVDPDLVVAALERAKSLLREVSGGAMGSNLKSGRLPRGHFSVSFHPLQLKNVMGIEIPPEETESIFKRIGCFVTDKKDSWLVSVPSYRNDLKMEIDLVEEVARFHGYDLIPSVLPQVQLLSSKPATPVTKSTEMRDLLVSAGFDEVVTSSFSVSGAFDFSTDVFGVPVMNPLSQEQKKLRESILPALVQVVIYNLNQGNSGLRFFELGRVYQVDGLENARSFTEESRIGLVMTGEKKDILVLKSLIGDLAKRFGLGNLEVGPIDRRYFDFPECTPLILPDGHKFAVLGVIPVVKSLLLFAEVYVEGLLNFPPCPVRFRDWPKVPAVIRDYSFLVSKLLSWAEIEKKVRGLSELISRVTFFDLYQSSEYPAGFQSMAFSVCFQSPERTLTHSDIDAVQKDLISELEGMGLKFKSLGGFSKE